MKKLLAVLLALNAVLVSGLCWKELTVHADGGGAFGGNGDVNGDGEINITDVIGLLNWLYLGGDAPVPIPPTEKGLPATNQTRCFNNNGEEMGCASADFPGQDGFYQAGCPGEERFVDHGDGTVTDTCTGLMWQKDTADVNGSGSIGAEDRLDWQGALKYCEDLDFAGHDDWRLPNVRELQSIVDYGRSSPAIDTTVFRALSVWYWTSSSGIDGPGAAWGVRFDIGYVSNIVKPIQGSYVRAVRSGP